MSRYISSLAIGLLLLGAAACNDDTFEDLENGGGKGYLNINLSLGGDTRATEDDGEDNYHENDINSVDIYLYDTGAGEDARPKLFRHFGSTVKTVGIPLNEVAEAFAPATSCKVVAVANCAATHTKDTPTLAELKVIELTADFRKNEKQAGFVMTNFAQDEATATWTEEEGAGTVVLKRVAAKIRMALDVVPSITEGGKEWKPDLTDMRLFISNGVNKGRLDGAQIELQQSDYYSVVTSGQPGSADYEVARKLTHPGGQASGAPEGEKFEYYNTLPYYTYPNDWEASMFDNTQTMLTVVVPWKHIEGGTETYLPTYYTIPVTQENVKKIESNKYYYIRMHVGIMGSITPEKPVEVKIECEIADWGKADDTTIDLRPVRYLNFNQKEFVMNNVEEIEIPFESTHNCIVESFSGEFYTFFGNYGDKITRNFDTTFKGTFFDYSIDNTRNVLKFNHKFFDYWRPTYTNNKLTGLQHSDTESRTGSNSNPVIYARLFTPFKVQMTVRHNVGDGYDNSYKETVFLTIYPGVYVDVDNISDYGRNRNDGWIMINGYGTNNNGTGGLQDFGSGINSGDAGALTILSATTLNSEESLKWVLSDPRTNFINNELSTASTGTDSSDNMTTWTSGNGPFDGSQTGNNRGGECKLIWEHFPTASPVAWNGTTWDPTADTQARKLKYYYPASELSGKGNILAPKIIVCSYHSYSGSMSRETARRRCAAFQQYGYPAGRWRLPTGAEIAIFKTLQKYQRVNDIFYRDISNNTSGVGTNWSNMGATGNGETFGTSGNSYVRCVYDLWYWEKVDANKVSTARIPAGTGNENWKKFYWGDRPKETILTRGGKAPTVEEYLQENAPGNYVVVGTGGNKKLEKWYR